MAKNDVRQSRRRGQRLVCPNCHGVFNYMRNGPSVYCSLDCYNAERKKGCITRRVSVRSRALQILDNEGIQTPQELALSMNIPRRELLRRLYDLTSGGEIAYYLGITAKGKQMLEKFEELSSRGKPK